MKKISALFLALLFLLLAGCNTGTHKTDPTTTPMISNLDYNQYTCTHGSWAQAQDGYYILTDNKRIADSDAVSFLYFMDHNLNCAPLCGRPECDHQNADCDALIDTLGIYYHKDHLYYISTKEFGKRGVYQMSLTGQDRRLVQSLEFLNAYESYGLSTKKCGPYLVVNYEAPDISIGNNQVVYLVSLDNDEPPTCIFGELGEEDATSYTPWTAKYPWLFVLGAKTEHGYEVLGYNVETQERSLIFNFWSMNLMDVYASEKELDWFLMGDGFYRHDLSTGETKKLREADPAVELGGGAYDDQYIYLYNATKGIDDMGVVPADQRGLHIYDRDGNRVAFISAEGLEHQPSYAFSTADRVFFYDFPSLNKIPCYYIEKDKIPSGELQWIPIEAGLGEA